uniref:Coiled-coil domain containing 82 n=1 Tax=Pelodiscus sinensis TaxID=13735 RepID=K7FGI3_PELSI|nr:coiled-coil domain-containing protein 82 [Pelodiscus sinensis]XP_006128827.1 coiled-coil domain-containing protein 82 [Pelodiscus sinensis]XP_006128828.1 coiled-coil domain-containing protein 82 [Pelodiscus sinensis]|eukprot:XP_006128826.1 coiled-coil domain-containing protein 82 [Pelodiscus sinensis]
MEIKPVNRRYETRRHTRIEEPASKSRVDWRRTKRETILLESDEEPASASEPISASEDEQLSTTSEDELAEKQETVVKRENLSDHEEKDHDDTITEDAEDECITPGKRKRSSTSVMYDSDRSDDSDILVRKVFAKRYCIMDEDESSQEQEHTKTPSAEDLTNGKQKRLMNLKELARQRSTQTSSNSKYCEDSHDDVEIIEESSYHLPLTPTESSDDDDSMKDFIVEDEEESAELVEDENQPQRNELATSEFQLLKYYIPRFSRCDHYIHFQRVVKAFLINTIDDTFLSSLYDGTRQKRYAKEMLTSLHYLDDRFIQPRLENLVSRSRWKERYKERVNCYPEVHIVMKTPLSKCCQACELHRYCKFDILLSGKLYNNRTLETDDFMSHDKQVLKVGRVCASRTRVYHNLKHFKYKLYQRCCSVTEVDGIQDEPVKDTVDRLFSQLEEKGWIQERYDHLEEYINDADYFQEEKMD